MTNASVSPSVAPKTSVDEIPWNKHMSQQRSISDWIVDIIIWVLIVAIVAVVIYPIWFIVVASFSDQTQVSAGNVTVWPKGFTVAGYTACSRIPASGPATPTPFCTPCSAPR